MTVASAGTSSSSLHDFGEDEVGRRGEEDGATAVEAAAAAAETASGHLATTLRSTLPEMTDGTLSAVGCEAATRGGV